MEALADRVEHTESGERGRITMTWTTLSHHPGMSPDEVDSGQAIRRRSRGLGSFAKRTTDPAARDQLMVRFRPLSEYWPEVRGRGEDTTT